MSKLVWLGLFLLGLIVAIAMNLAEAQTVMTSRPVACTQIGDKEVDKLIKDKQFHIVAKSLKQVVRPNKPEDAPLDVIVTLMTNEQNEVLILELVPEINRMCELFSGADFKQYKPDLKPTYEN